MARFGFARDSRCASRHRLSPVLASRDGFSADDLRCRNRAVSHRQRGSRRAAGNPSAPDGDRGFTIRVEELGDSPCTRPGDGRMTEFAFERHWRSRRRRTSDGLRLGIHLRALVGRERHIAAGAAQSTPAILRERARIAAIEIAADREAQPVHEDGGDHAAAARAGAISTSEGVPTRRGCPSWAPARSGLRAHEPACEDHSIVWSVSHS